MMSIFQYLEISIVVYLLIGTFIVVYFFIRNEMYIDDNDLLTYIFIWSTVFLWIIHIKKILKNVKEDILFVKKEFKKFKRRL